MAINTSRYNTNTDTYRWKYLCSCSRSPPGQVSILIISKGRDTPEVLPARDLPPLGNGSPPSDPRRARVRYIEFVMGLEGVLSDRNIRPEPAEFLKTERSRKCAAAKYVMPQALQSSNCPRSKLWPQRGESLCESVEDK